MAGEGKERYRIMIIVLLMRCIRPLLRELIQQIAARKTPHGESEWTVDDYLRHNRKTVERKLPKIGRDSKYKNILYPPNSVKQKTDLGKWDLTLYLFIFNDIAMVNCNLKCYLESVSSIRKDLCSRDVHGLTKVVCKEYRKRLKRARSWLYKILHDKELEKSVQRRVRNIEKEKMEQSEVVDVLARWKTLECDVTEDGVEKTGFQKYLTISVLLKEVCCEVMQALVKRRVVDKKHHSLQSFLHQHEPRIRRRSDTLDKWGRYEEKLFPRHGEPNLEEWDTCLLCWVLLNLCYLGEIKNEHNHPIIEDAIGTFRRIRNATVHKPNVILSKEEYNSYLEGIRCGVNDCLYFLNDKDISDDILNKIEDIENEGIDNDETMRRVQTSYHNEKNEHVLHTKYLEGQVSIHKELSEIVRLHKGVTLPETQLEILIENCSQESEEILSKMLVQKINNNIAGNEPRSIEYDEMTAAVANLIKTWRSKGWNPVSSTKGSVLLHAQCVSFDNLCELFDTYGNTGSAMCVEDIQTAARRFIGDNVNIYCIMYDSVMNKAMEKIVCQLLEITEQQVARAGKAENNHRASVNVLMAPGFNGISSDISSLISEDVRGQLRRIADILKKQYGLTNCSITTRSYDSCTPSLVTEEKCNGVTESDDNKMTWDNAYGDISPVNDDQQSLNMEYETLRCVANRPDYCSPSLVMDQKCNEVSESDDDKMPWNSSDGDPFSTKYDQQSLSVDNGAGRCAAKIQVTDEKCNDVSESNDDKMTWNSSDGDPFSTKYDQQSQSVDNEARRCDAKIQELQDDLISFYRDNHGTISLSPLLEGDIPLLKFYVMPDIYSLKQQMTRSGAKQEKTAITPLRNMFYNDNKMCRKIYLKAGAGRGKTVLSKRLTLIWCHANKPHEDEEQYISQEEIQAVNGFSFVFLLLLRNSSSECDIDDLIWNQIISQLEHDNTREDLVNILCKERCLVILDGLDEWIHPSNTCKHESSPIPHQKVREQTAVLTTTRPWKLSVSDLQSSQIDQELEIFGLNQESANILKRAVISDLLAEKSENKLQHNVAEFTRAVKEKQIANLEESPRLLMYLLFLWCNKIELAQSQCDLYSQITELLLSRTVQNYIELSPKVYLPQGAIPQCLSEKVYCTQFYTLLTALGQLAYRTLLRQTREERTFVFNNSVTEQYLNKDCLNFCLKTGLLTQSKVPGTLLEQKSEVSFAHKTLQEYFAAIYLHSTSNQISVPKIVLSKCKCIKDILEMSKIIQFSCGMNVNVSSLISLETMKIINEDETTREYRSNLESSKSLFGFGHPLKDFQDMYILCCKEIPRENQVSLCLQDVIIEESCKQEQYRETLKLLTTRNKQNIRSLYINMDYIPYSSVHEVIEYFEVNDPENIEKIHCEGEFNGSDLAPLLNKSVKCLYLSCSWRGSWSRLPFETVTSLQKLEAIHINKFRISHSELSLLYDYISQRHRMRQIELERLLCTDHGRYSCTGYSLDLSQHSRLNRLILHSTPVSESNINMASLEMCRLVCLSNRDLVLCFVNCVPADSKLNAFDCTGPISSVAIETMLETLRLSVHVKHVRLQRINIGNKELFTSEMVNIERVELLDVTMAASVFQRIVDVLQQQPQTVAVNIGFCDIKPESEFVTVKQKIKTSRRHFRVLRDSEDVLEFETIKKGD